MPGSSTFAPVAPSTPEPRPKAPVCPMAPATTAPAWETPSALDRTRALRSAALPRRHTFPSGAATMRWHAPSSTPSAAGTSPTRTLMTSDLVTTIPTAPSASARASTPPRTTTCRRAGSTNRSPTSIVLAMSGIATSTSQPRRSHTSTTSSSPRQACRPADGLVSLGLFHPRLEPLNAVG
jgi:hypothetical protein